MRRPRPANHRYTTTIHGNNRRAADRGRVQGAHEAVAGATLYVKGTALALLLNQRDALHLPWACKWAVLSVPPSLLSCPRPHASKGSARGSHSLWACKRNLVYTGTNWAGQHSSNKDGFDAPRHCPIRYSVTYDIITMPQENNFPHMLAAAPRYPLQVGTCICAPYLLFLSDSLCLETICITPTCPAVPPHRRAPTTLQPPRLSLRRRNGPRPSQMACHYPKWSSLTSTTHYGPFG
jgi:hypothetical protein